MKSGGFLAGNADDLIEPHQGAGEEISGARPHLGQPVGRRAGEGRAGAARAVRQRGDAGLQGSQSAPARLGLSPTARDAAAVSSATRPVSRSADAVDGDYRLRAAVDAELLQDSRDVRLDGGLRHAELEGDLLVEQPFAQHHEHAHLLRRERGEPRYQLRALSWRHIAQVDVGRQLHLAADDARGSPRGYARPAAISGRSRGAAIEALADRGRIVAGRDDHDRHLRDAGRADRAAPRRRARRASDRSSRMRSVSFAVASRSVSSSSEPASRTSAFSERRAQRLAERTAKQRVVIDDDEPVVRHASRASEPQDRAGRGRGAGLNRDRSATSLKSSGFWPEWLMSARTATRFCEEMRGICAVRPIMLVGGRGPAAAVEPRIGANLSPGGS